MGRAAACPRRRRAGLHRPLGAVAAGGSAAVTVNAWLPLAILASSLIPGLIIFTLPERAVALRTTLNLGGAVVKILLLVLMMVGVFHGVVFEVRIPLVPGLDFVLHADALSLLFVNLSAVLWRSEEHTSELQSLRR